MFRSLPAIIFCLQIVQPHMSYEQAKIYAKSIQKTAFNNEFDPITAIAIIQNESRWRPEAISPDGEDYGLAQIRARYRPGCIDDEDPVNNPSLRCKLEKQKLLTAHYSITVMGNHIRHWKQFCEDMTGIEPSYEQWMSGYGGFTYPSDNIWCNMQKIDDDWVALDTPKVVLKIKGLRDSLIFAWNICSFNPIKPILSMF